MRFHTENSLYEIDFANKRIRRISGYFDATPRQGEDEQWRSYLHITEIIEGRCVYISWNIDSSVLKGTLTSKVTAILN